MTPQIIRVCLNEDGTVAYVPWYKNADEADDCGDYADAIPPVEALNFMRAGTPFEVACGDPHDPHSNYETLNQQSTLTRI